jgi:hypothetical protein
MIAKQCQRRVSQLARLVMASLAFACAWLVTAALDALGAPDWAMFMGGALILESIVVLVAMLHRWAQTGEGHETQAGPRGEEGGVGPRRQRPDRPPPGGGASDPSWWPEFERLLSLYVAERERESRQRACSR